MGRFAEGVTERVTLRVTGRATLSCAAVSVFTTVAAISQAGSCEEGRPLSRAEYFGYFLYCE